MPWTAITSSESSILRRVFSNVTASKQMTPAISPQAKPPIGPMKPDAGVTVARPATAPVTTPTHEVRP